MATREKTVTAGRMVYCVSYPVPRYSREDTDRQRGEKRRESGAWQAKLNRLRSCEKLEQLIYCNFGRGDLYVTLTYRDEELPGDRRQVMRDFKLFRKRLAALRRARGDATDYIYIMEHKHGAGRWHIHLLLRGTGEADREEISRCWRKGRVHIEYFSYSRAEELSRYLAKESPDGVGDHPWIASRGLRRPVVTSELVPDGTQLAAPFGAIVRKREVVQNSYGTFVYLKYFLAA